MPPIVGDVLYFLSLQYFRDLRCSYNERKIPCDNKAPTEISPSKNKPTIKSILNKVKCRASYRNFTVFVCKLILLFCLQFRSSRNYPLWPTTSSVTWHSPFTPPFSRVSGHLFWGDPTVCESLCKVCNIMAEGINSFAYKYCLSSLAATVAETGKSTIKIFGLWWSAKWQKCQFLFPKDVVLATSLELAVDREIRHVDQWISYKLNYKARNSLK